MLFQIVFIAYVRNTLGNLSVSRASARIYSSYPHRTPNAKVSKIGVVSVRIGAEHVLTCVFGTEKQYKRIRSQSF